MTPDASTALALIQKLNDLGIEGQAPGMATSVRLAENYLSDSRYATHDARIDSLIRWGSSKSFTTGFATGLGGFVVLPVTVPAAIGAAWIVQARMVGAIAHMRGYDLEDDRVRTLAFAAIAGDATAKEAVRRVGADLATRASKQAVHRVSGRALIEINKKVGFRLLTKAGTTGVINLSKAIPIVGGVVGGAVDGASTRIIGRIAKETFAERPHDGMGAFASAST
jgi:EcsC protein family